MNVDDIIEQNRDVYNRIAKHFFNKRQVPWRELDVLTDFTQVGDRVLDLGCGFGRLYDVLKKKHIVYTGVDQSEGQLSVAKEMYPDLIFIQAEMSKLPLEDASCDVVYAIAAFHHIPVKRRAKTIDEIKRVVRSGGHLVMTNWNLESDWAKSKMRNGEWKIEADGGVVVPWKDEKGARLGDRIYYSLSPKDLKSMFEEAGFTTKEQYFVTKGNRVSDTDGENVVSVFIRQ